MAESDQELDETLKSRSEIENKEVTKFHIIPVELMSGYGKLLKTVENSSDQHLYTMRDNEVEIKFIRPVFVSEINLVLGRFDNVKGMKLIVSDVLTGRLEKKSITVEKVSGPSVRFSIGKVVTSFAIYKESIFSKDIKKISVSGLFLDELERFEFDQKDLLSLKEGILESIDEKISELEEQQEQINSNKKLLDEKVVSAGETLRNLNEASKKLKEETAVLQEENATILKNIDQQKNQLSAVQSKNEELSKRNINIESELEQKTQTLSSTNIAISKSEEKLKTLVNNVNVFSEEFVGFVEQGRKQVNLYTGLMVVPLLLLSVVVYNLFKGAVDLSTKFVKIPNIDLVTLVVTRMPFVAVASLIIGVSVKIIYFLIGRITAIHQQRLDMAKIAIIAKDVSDASAAGMQMTSEEVYESKTYLKMALLKAYLSGQMENFSYPIIKNEKSENRKSSELKDDGKVEEGEESEVAST